MSSRDIELFINDIKEAIEAIFDYVKDEDIDSFSEDRKTYSAVIREFEIIGEATKHFPLTLIEKYPNIGWRDIKDFRNLLIHQYFGVDFEIVWNTIKRDLPKLHEVINKMLEENR